MPMPNWPIGLRSLHRLSVWLADADSRALGVCQCRRRRHFSLRHEGVFGGANLGAFG